MRVRHVERADVSAVLAIAGKRTVPFERGIFNDDTDYEALTESCFLSLILEKEDGTVIGAASFSDTPPAYATESAAWLKEETEVLGRVPEDFLYVHYLLLPEDETQEDIATEALHALLKTAFSFNPAWQALLAVVPMAHNEGAESALVGSSDDDDNHAGSSANFSILTQDDSLVVFEAVRTNFLSPVIVRRARVEDYDDLLPVLESSAKRYPRLSAIPADESDVQDFALARLINSGDPRRVVLVAERKGTIEGMVVLSDEVDVDALANAYNLQDYDNLVERKDDESDRKKGYDEDGDSTTSKREARRRASTKKMRQPSKIDIASLSGDALIEALAMGELDGPPPEEGDEEEEEEEGDEGEGEEDGEEDDMGGEGLTSTDGGQQGGDALLEGALRMHAEYEDENKITEEERESVAPIVTRARAASSSPRANNMVVPKAITMPMVCVDDALTDVADSFLTESFNAFPSKSFCTLTFPHSSAVPLMLSRFNGMVPIQPEAGADMLYVANRKATMHTFEVRRVTEPEDFEKAEKMLAALPDRLDALAALAAAMEDGAEAVIASCGGDIVGFAAIETQSATKDALLVNLSEHYKPQDTVLNLRSTEVAGVGVLAYFTLSPLFTTRKRTFLVEVLRVLGLSCIIDSVDGRHEKQTKEAVAEMIQIPGKEVQNLAERPSGGAGGGGGGGGTSSGLSGTGSGAAGGSSVMHDANATGEDSLLYAFSRKIAYRSRASVNSRVVVVGASKAGLAAVEEMLVSTSYTFASLTLVTNGATNSGDEASARALARLALEVNLTIVDAEMVSLNRETRRVSLSDDSTLPYEVLLLTPELRDQTCTSVGINAASARDSVMRYEDLLVGFDSKRAASVETVIVYGNTPEAYASMRQLLARGLRSEQILWMKSAVNNDSVGELIGECMHRAGLGPALDAVRQCVPGVIQGLDVDDEDRVLVEYMPRGSDLMETLVCDVLVTCDAPNTDINVFESINDNGIVYDGRVVVNASFQTNDRDIYAAGDVAKFSRACGAGDVPLGYFDADEMGRNLAASLMARFKEDGKSSLADIGPETPPEYPRFAKARTVSVPVPGPGKFFIVGDPATFLSLHCSGGEFAPPATGRCVSTIEDGFTCLMLDADERITSVLYCGALDVNVHFMQKLVGLLPEHLNDFLPRLESGEITSLPRFFNQAWADAVYHPDFLAFKDDIYESVRACLLDAEQGSAPEEYEVVKLVQESMMQFIRAHRGSLTGYHVEV